MSILGTLATVAVSTFIPGGAIALAVWHFGKDAVLGSAKDAGKAIVGLPWAKIWWTIPCAAFLIFGLIERHGKHSAEAKIPALQQQAANSHAAFLLEKKAFATEKVSLDAARAQITDTNNRILAQAADLEQAKRDAAAAVARNANLARSTDARIAALQVAATKHGTPCTLSDEAKKELDNQ